MDKNNATDHQSKPDTRPHIRLEINDTAVDALVDSGASFTLMRADVYHALPNKPPLQPRFANLGALNDTPIPNIGEIYGSVRINLVTWIIPIIIVPHMHSEFILGNDFLRKFQALLDQDKNQLVLHTDPKQSPVNQERQFMNIPPVTPIHQKLYLDQELVLDPRTRITYQLPNNRGSFSGIVEPSTRFRRLFNASVARTLTAVRNGIMYVQFLNMEYRPVTIPAGTLIGHFIPYDDIILQHEHGQVASVDNAQVPAAQKEDFFKKLDHSFRKSKISTSQSLALKEVLFHYRDLFADNDEAMTNVSNVKCHINLTDPNSQPVQERLRRTTPQQKATINEEIDYMLKNNVIEPSESPWAAPIHLVKKKNGTFRFCIDFRGLNALTKKDAYPLPRIDDTLDSLAGMVYFTTLDARKGYWQILMNLSDREKTAFISHRGLFQFKRMPFGLTNAPATFQRMMDLVLSGLLYELCLVYIDDIIIFSRTFEDHLKNIQTVLDRLRSANIKLSPEKCNFCLEEIPFLGHVISSKGCSPNPDKVAAIINWPVPQHKTELKSFLGIAGYYRRFIPDFATIAEPLTSLTSKKALFKWESAQQRAFNSLKLALTTKPLLRFPDFNKDFVLYTDASDVGVGAVLEQPQEDPQQPSVIAYWSRVLDVAERNYTTTEKECLAFVDACKIFRPYLIGRKFTVILDHIALKWLKETTDTNSRICRWSLKLQDYDFDIVHRPGSTHANADALSRIPATKIDIASAYEDPEFDTVLKNLNIAQLEDPIVSRYFKYLKEGVFDTDDKNEVQRIYMECKDLVLGPDNIVYRSFAPAAHNRKFDLAYQLVIPLSMRYQILQLCHDSKMGGHLGFFKTLDRVRQRFYWPNMQRDIRNYVLSCEFCNKRKFRRHPKFGKMGRVQGKFPFDVIGVDILGPLKKSHNGNKYIVVFIDYFTKLVEAFAIPDMEAQTIAKLLLDEVVFRYGAPSRILSDKGSQFTSQLLKDLTTFLQTKKIFTTPYHPQTDGLVEKFNQTLATMLSAFVSRTEKNWDENLRAVIFSYNTVIQASTGYSPAELVFGRILRLPCDLDLIRSKNTDPTSLNEWVREQLYKLNDAYKLATEALNKAHAHQKKNADRGKSDHEFNVGDLVYKKIPVISGQKKFQPRYEGPFKVIEKLNNLTYLITSESDPAQRFHIHIEKLAPVTLRDPALMPQPKIKEKRIIEKVEEKEEEDLDLHLLENSIIAPATSETKPEEEELPETWHEEEGKTTAEILEEIYNAPDPEVQPRSRRRQLSALDTFYLLRNELSRLKLDIERMPQYPLIKISKKLKELLGTGSAFVLSSLSRKFDKEIPQIKTRTKSLTYIADLLDHFDIRFAKEITRLNFSKK